MDSALATEITNRLSGVKSTISSIAADVVADNHTGDYEPELVGARTQLIEASKLIDAAATYVRAATK